MQTEKGTPNIKVMKPKVKCFLKDGKEIECSEAEFAIGAGKYLFSSNPIQKEAKQVIETKEEKTVKTTKNAVQSKGKSSK